MGSNPKVTPMPAQDPKMASIAEARAILQEGEKRGPDWFTPREYHEELRRTGNTTTTLEAVKKRLERGFNDGILERQEITGLDIAKRRNRMSIYRVKKENPDAESVDSLRRPVLRSRT